MYTISLWVLYVKFIYFINFKMCVLGVQYKRPCEVQSQETLPFTSKNKQAGRLYPRASVFQSGQSGIKLVCARVRERVHMCVCVYNNVCVSVRVCVSVQHVEVRLHLNYTHIHWCKS